MNGKCFDIGTIQAFLDGETAQELSLRISGHVADCHNCAAMLADAEEESSAVFSVLDRELNALVPTQRLWSKINESIEVEKNRLPFWEKLRHSLAVFAVNPLIAVTASVIIVFSVFAAVWTMRSNVAADVAGTGNSPIIQKQPDATVTIAATGGDDILPVGQQIRSSATAEKSRNNVANAGFIAGNNRPRVQNISYREPVPSEYIPGEESYVKTIAGLKQNVDGDKDSVLPPSSRIAYERDMAVVDDAITRMKAVVQKNPKNQSAKQVLYSSYQNKIDLLNSVAQREELLASVR